MFIHPLPPEIVDELRSVLSKACVRLEAIDNPGHAGHAGGGFQGELFAGDMIHLARQDQRAVRYLKPDRAAHGADTRFRSDGMTNIG